MQENDAEAEYMAAFPISSMLKNLVPAMMNIPRCDTIATSCNVHIHLDQLRFSMPSLFHLMVFISYRCEDVNMIRVLPTIARLLFTAVAVLV
jgi:hypothetical protein